MNDLDWIESALAAARPRAVAALLRYFRDLDTAEEAVQNACLRALSENGTVTMPIQETFWAARFGMLVDQFGTPWMVNCEKTATQSATAA